MRKTPFRPDDRQITQPYRDGVVRIYTVTDAAQPGYQPRPALTLLETLFYQERRVGLQRYYSGKQAQVQVERVIRTQLRPGISPQCVAITEDGVQYGIDLVQRAEDVYPASMDRTQLLICLIQEHYGIIGLGGNSNAYYRPVRTVSGGITVTF